MIVSASFSGICDLKLMRGVWGLFITFITGSFPYYHAILDILYLLHKASQTLMLSVHTRSITLLFLSSTKIRISKDLVKHLTIKICDKIL